MKKKINEKMGGGMRIGLGGANSAGPHYDYYKTRNPTGYHSGGYTGNADSQISQRHALTSTIEEDEDLEEDEKENLMEFFARIIKMPLTESDKKSLEENSCSIKENHCSTHESKCTMSETQCDESIRLEEELAEISAGGVAGATTPLGTNSKAEVPSEEDENKRHLLNKKFFGGLN
jgi:hypothetical protein